MNLLKRIERSTLLLAAIGAVLYWAALPPLGIAILGFVAPVAWIRLIRFRRLPGRAPYWTLYLVGVLWFLAMFHFLRLPHWSTSIAWVLAALYFGMYLPIFIALCRVAVHRLKISVVLAAPVVWTAIELAKEYVLTGCSAAALGHTQYETLELIQIADLAGAHGVSFLLMLIAAAIGRTIPLSRVARPMPLPCDRRPVIWPLAVAAIVLTFAWFYGTARITGIKSSLADEKKPQWRVVLIQGNIDSQIKSDPEMLERVQDEYEQLTRTAVKEVDNYDLIVWPETMFRYPIISEFPNDDGYTPMSIYGDGYQRLNRLREDVGRPMLLGIDHLYINRNLPPEKQIEHFWNSAILVLPNGYINGTYNKQHLVICGEYMPLARQFPWLMNFTPLSVNMSPGTRAQSLIVPPRNERERPLRIAPNICFESYLSRVIRGQVNELIARSESPDVMVNVTNDGWFYGSSQLDLHLINAVFRAVECRRPFLIAANTGISAVIAPTGQIVEQAERRTSTHIVADVTPSQRSSVYLRTGDIFSGICLAASIGFGLAGFTGRKRRRRRRQLRKIFKTPLPRTETKD